MESLDNNFGRNPNTPVMKPAVQYALIFAGISIALFLIGHYGNVDQENMLWKMVGWVSSIAMVGWMIKHFRDTKNGGFLRIGQGLGLSTLVGLFSGILTGIVMYVFVTVIDPSYMNKIQDQAIINMEQQGLSEAQIEQSMEIASMFMSPGALVFYAILGGVISCLILGLIFSAIFKRD